MDAETPPKPQPDLSKFKTTRQLAKMLQHLPDLPVVISVRQFDMPGLSTAYPVTPEIIKVQDTDVVLLRVDDDAFSKPESGPGTETP